MEAVVQRARRGAGDLHRGRPLEAEARAITLLLIAVVAALPLAAVSFDAAQLARMSGVRLDGGEKVRPEEGQTLTAKVVNAAVLAKIGLKGVRNGEVAEVALLSLRDGRAFNA